MLEAGKPRISGRWSSHPGEPSAVKKRIKRSLEKLASRPPTGNAVAARNGRRLHYSNAPDGSYENRGESGDRGFGLIVIPWAGRRSEQTPTCA